MNFRLETDAFVVLLSLVNTLEQLLERKDKFDYILIETVWQTKLPARFGSTRS